MQYSRHTARLPGRPALESHHEGPPRREERSGRSRAPAHPGRDVHPEALPRRSAQAVPHSESRSGRWWRTAMAQPQRPCEPRDVHTLPTPPDPVSRPGPTSTNCAVPPAMQNFIKSGTVVCVEPTGRSADRPSQPSPQQRSRQSTISEKSLRERDALLARRRRFPTFSWTEQRVTNAPAKRMQASLSRPRHTSTSTLL